MGRFILCEATPLWCAQGAESEAMHSLKRTATGDYATVPKASTETR